MDYEYEAAAIEYDKRTVGNPANGRGMNNAVGNVNQSEPELARAINEVHQLRKAIEETRATLTDFTDRMLVGQSMANDVCSDDQAVPSFNSGITGQLRRAISDAQGAASDVLRLSHMLRQIG